MGFASIALVKRDLLCRWRWLSERRRREQICLLSAITSHGGDHAATGASKQLRVEWPGILALTWAHWNEQCNRGVNAEDASIAFMLGLWICRDRKRRTMARFYQPDLSRVAPVGLELARLTQFNREALGLALGLRFALVNHASSPALRNNIGRCRLSLDNGPSNSFR
jgi:hypothetical protein